MYYDINIEYSYININRSFGYHIILNMDFIFTSFFNNVENLDSILYQWPHPIPNLKMQRKIKNRAKLLFVLS